MEHDVRFIHQFGQEATLHYGFKETAYGGVVSQVTDVVNGACAQIVQNYDLLSPCNKSFGQMRPDESCPACNQ